MKKSYVLWKIHLDMSSHTVWEWRTAIRAKSILGAEKKFRKSGKMPEINGPATYIITMK